MMKQIRLVSKKDLLDWLGYEKANYQAHGNITLLFPIAERDILYKHNYILRHAEYHTNNNHKIRSFLWRIFLLRYQNKYAIHIPINTCGKGLKIMHVGPVLINGNAYIGSDCSFHINTALVAGGNNDNVPEIGNEIIMGIGSVVVGGVKLANKIAVGANSVVTKSFTEEDITIAGIPAKKISDSGSTEWKTIRNKEILNG